MIKPTHIVVYKYDDAAATSVAPFEHEADAVRFYEKLAVNWSEVYLCRVLRGPWPDEEEEEK